MNKGLLTSIICFTSLLLFSCGSKTVKVTILECSHCSFEEKKIANVGQDFDIQAYLDKGYQLDTDSSVIEINAGGIHLLESCFSFNQSNNRLTIDKKYTHFGDITIKGNAFVKENVLTYHINSGSYDGIQDGDHDIVMVEGSGDYEKIITSDGIAIEKNLISISPSDIIFEYNLNNDKTLRIKQEYCYTDIVVTLG